MVRRRASFLSDGTSVQEPHTKSYGYIYIICIYIYIHIYIYSIYIHTIIHIYYIYIFTYGNTMCFFSFGNDPQMVDFPLIKLFLLLQKLSLYQLGMSQLDRYYD